MRLVFEDAAFAAMCANPSTGITLFFLLQEREHGILLNTQGTEFLRWTNALTSQLQRELNDIIRFCREREGLHPSDIEHVVGGAAGCIQVAINVAMDPALLVVEDDIDDWNFLLAIAAPDHRKALEQAKERSRLSIQHGGGVNGLQTRATREVHTRNKAGRIPGRVFAAIDSDSLYKGHVEPKIKNVEYACKNTLGCDAVHVLSRRSIENYLPNKAFDDWLSQPSGEAQALRETRVKTIKDLGDHSVSKLRTLRHYHNIKNGLNGDHKRIKTFVQKSNIDLEDTLNDPTVPAERIMRNYSALSPPELQSIRKGFGEQIASHYTTNSHWYAMTPDWCDDESRRELNPFLSRILRRI